MASIALLLALIASAGVQSPEAGVAVGGTVFDQTGAILAGAPVDISDGSGNVVQRSVTDDQGAFHFSNVKPGTYVVRTVVDGFKPGSLRVRVASRTITNQKLVLELAAIAQEVTVSDRRAEVGANAASNVDAVTVDADFLNDLPVFDRDIVATMSRFLDAGAIGNGGVTLVVNGMEVRRLDAGASAIARVNINQDPYSAEYSRPGRGRIEILTKPGSQKFAGELNLVGRDARFNARNAFADSQPSEQRRIIEGFTGGPVRKGGKTAFTISVDDERDDTEALIHAAGPQGIIQDQLPQGSAESRTTLGITHQISNRNTISIRPNYTYESDTNRNAGGTTLASAASTFIHHEQQVTFTQQTILTASLVNQFQILAGHERETTASLTPDRAIVVNGAFTGGGAQADLVRTEWHINLNESLAWSHGRHQVQAGFQLPDWSRRGFFDRTNFGGTFYFADLDAYAAGRPYSFTQQSGNGELAFLEKQVGAYLKDDWQLRTGLTLSIGLRYDWQNYFHDDNNVSPRVSVAFAPGNKRSNVIRAGVGVFTDRSGPVVIADILHDRPGGLTRYVITDPSYPDPFAGGATAASLAPSIVRLAPGIQIPQLVQWSLGVDRQLQKTTTLALSYTQSHGFNQFRSRDVNAPAPPLYASRPNADFGVVREVESTARQNSRSFTATLRGRVGTRVNGQAQYTWSRILNDSNGINAFPANDYDLAGEWARADADRTHRFAMLARVSVFKAIDCGVSVSANSGGPYTLTLGGDPYNNGRGRARPAGVARNTLEGDGYRSLDVRASRTVKFGDKKGDRSLAIGLDAFNIGNRVNYSSYVGTISSPLFGQPVAARPARQLQLSLRVSY